MVALKNLHWTSRVLAILFAVYLSVFAMDVFIEGATSFEVVMALLVHLVPTFLVIIALVIAWRWEEIGGALFIFLGLFYMIMMKNQALSTYLMISGTLSLIGVLFIIESLFREEEKEEEEDIEEYIRDIRMHDEKKRIAVLNPFAKTHTIHNKSKNACCWKAVKRLSDINLHDTVRLAKNPKIEGEIRHIDNKKKKVEFNHLGRPVFAKINDIRVLKKSKVMF